MATEAPAYQDPRLKASCGTRGFLNFQIHTLRALGTMTPGGFTYLADTVFGPIMKSGNKSAARKWLVQENAEGCPVPSEWLSLKEVEGNGNSKSDVIIVWFPGGGFVTRSPSPVPFSLACLPRLQAALPKNTPLPKVLAVNYALPATADEAMTACEEAMAWALQHGKKLILGGDSAGGYLAVVMSRRAAAGELSKVPTDAVIGTVGVCAWLDLTFSLPAFRENAYNDMLSRRWIRSGAEAFVSKRVAAGADKATALRELSPAVATGVDWSVLPKGSMMLIHGDRDRFRDDTFELAKKAPDGVKNVLVKDGVLGTHCGCLNSSSPTCDAIWEDVARFLAARIAWGHPC